MAAQFFPLTEAWTKIGDNVSAITAVNDGKTKLYVMATAADVAPAAGSAGIPLEEGQGVSSSDLSEFRISAPGYVWARAVRDGVIVSIT